MHEYNQTSKQPFSRHMQSQMANNTADNTPVNDRNNAMNHFG